MLLDDPDNPLAVEIFQETAVAYFAACRKMVAALDALEAHDRSLASALPTAAQTTRRTELLEEAAERVYFVVIQREAMRLSGYEKFFEDYEVPAEVKSRMGPKRKK